MRPLPEAYPEELTTVGDHIRKRRLDLGLLQKDVARLIGVTALTVKNWELGHTEPAIRYGPAITDFLEYIPTSPGRILSERLAAYRWIHGCSQEKAAAYVGVDETTWRKLEAGLSRPSRANMARLLETVEPSLGAATCYSADAH